MSPCFPFPISQSLGIITRPCLELDSGNQRLLCAKDVPSTIGVLATARVIFPRGGGGPASKAHSCNKPKVLAAWWSHMFFIMWAAVATQCFLPWSGSSERKRPRESAPRRQSSYNLTSEVTSHLFCWINLFGSKLLGLVHTQGEKTVEGKNTRMWKSLGDIWQMSAALVLQPLVIHDPSHMQNTLVFST